MNSTGHWKSTEYSLSDMPTFPLVYKSKKILTAEVARTALAGLGLEVSMERHGL